MKWYKADTGLKSHLKLRRLAKLLSISEVQALGHYHLLLSYTAEYAENGDLKTVDKSEIEDICGWEGDKNLLFDGFVSLHIIDTKTGGGFRTHGFYEKNTRHLKDIIRKRKARTGRGQGAPEAQQGRGQGALPTLPTLHNTTLPTKEPLGFVEFWKAYPRKENKGAARKMWLRHKPNLEAVLKAIEVQKGSAQWLKEGGKFIPHPATWINAEAWENEVTKKPQYNGASYV